VAELESPASVDELYLYRGDENVVAFRLANWEP